MNLCYEDYHVIHIVTTQVKFVIEIGILEILLKLLNITNLDVQVNISTKNKCNACGAIQSIAYQPIGRLRLKGNLYYSIIELHSVPVFCELLITANDELLLRLLGTLHNLSNDLILSRLISNNDVKIT